MDKVYVAYEHVPYECTNTLGVFSNRAKAEFHIAAKLFNEAVKSWEINLRVTQREFDDYVKYFVKGIPAGFGKPAQKFSLDEARQLAARKLSFREFHDCFEKNYEFYVQEVDVQ